MSFGDIMGNITDVLNAGASDYVKIQHAIKEGAISPSSATGTVPRFTMTSITTNQRWALGGLALVVGILVILIIRRS